MKKALTTTRPPGLLCQQGPGFRLGLGLGLGLGLALALQGCTSLPVAPDASATRVCTAQPCTGGAGRFETAPLMRGLQRLLARNEDAALPLCEADPPTGDCTNPEVGYFVLGGVLPGRGSARALSISAARLDADQQTLHFRLSMPLSFWGAPVRCDVHSATLQLAAPHRITLRGSEHNCNWLVVGIMKASFAFEVDNIDLERGRISGWWRHHVWGTGNGRGQGYATLQFPQALPPAEARVTLQ